MQSHKDAINGLLVSHYTTIEIYQLLLRRTLETVLWFEDSIAPWDLLQPQPQLHKNAR